MTTPLSMRATSCSLPFSYGGAVDGPPLVDRGADGRRPFGRFPAQRPLLSTSAGTPRPTPPPTCSRAPRSVCPSSSPDDLARAAEAREAGKGALVACAGCYPTATSLAAAPAVRAGVSSPKRARSWWTPFRASRARARRRPPARIFCFADETLKRTAWPRIAIRPRSSKFSTSKAPRVHAAPRAGEARTALHGQPAAFVRRPCGRRLRARALSRVLRGKSLRARAARGGHAEDFVGGRHERGPYRSGRERARPRAHRRCAIDNLVKGAAGQAVQCANAVLGLPQTAGLDVVAAPV